MSVSCVLCLTMLVNCLLNAFAICVGEVTVFSLKVIVLFLGYVGVLLANPCFVLQRVCVCCVNSFNDISKKCVGRWKTSLITR